MAAKKSTEAVNAAENSEVVNSTIEAKENDATGNNAAKKQEDVSVYTVDEFVKASGTAFDKAYSPDIIRAAMKMAGKTQATRAEAAEIINKFLGKGKEVAEK